MQSSDARGEDVFAPYGDEVRPPDLDTCRTYLERAFDALDQVEGALGNSAKLDEARFRARAGRANVERIQDELTHYEERHHG